MTPADTQALTKKVNIDLKPVNGTSISLSSAASRISSILEANGLDHSAIKLNGDTGRLHVSIGDGIWLTVTWYRFETTQSSFNKYEIVTYATSAHDDHRDPYTTVMSSPEKKSAKTKLAHLLEPVNKTYYRGKGAAFGAIQDAIAATQFDWHGFADATTTGQVNDDKGRLTAPIGNGIHMTVTWFKMEASGNYEIVAYAS